MIQLPALTWRASPNFSSRGGDKTRLIVVHDCEGNYEGSISWFAMPRSQVSAHIVLREDGAIATQMVTWATKAWHSCNFNPYSEGVEAAGYSAKGLGAPEWLALASIVAFRLKANGIPCQYATTSNGWTGYCQHVDLGAEGGGHHDISSDRDVVKQFQHLVQQSYASELPSTWVAGGPSPSPYVPNVTPRSDLVVGSLEWVQASLNALDYTPVLLIDGIDGPATVAAIKSFQAFYKLDVDGDPGPATCKQIAEALAALPVPTIA